MRCRIFPSMRMSRQMKASVITSYSIHYTKLYDARLAGSNMEMAGYGQMAEYMVGPALDSLEILKRRGEKFDFFLIDADKGNYPAYLEYAISLASPGALIAGDNTLLRGRTLNTDKNGPSVMAMRKFNEMIASDERLISTMLPAS